MAVLIGIYCARLGLSATQIGVILSSALLGSALAAFVTLMVGFVGMFNVHGRDRGAIPIVEQALLPATTSDHDRTRVFAWYNVLLDSGYAAGGLLAATPTLLEAPLSLSTLEAIRLSLGFFCVLYGAAAFLFPLREGLNEMDVPTRQSYVMAVVRPEERLAAAGITSLVRLCGWAAAPVLTGILMQAGGLGLPLIFAGAAKLSYDFLL